MLTLRRGRVVSVESSAEGWQRLMVDVDGAERAAAADVGLVGESEPGDEVVVNTAAVDLGLGSGGFDVVHVNLTRGLGGAGAEGAHVMKLNYTSLQHAVHPVEGPELAVPLAKPVGVFGLHGQLAPLAWAVGQARPGARVGYVQTPGGALPGAMSRAVGELRERGLLAVHVSAGPAYGGEREAITVAGALHHGLHDDGWDVAVCGPGPGILGSASALGHGGMAALDTAHAAMTLGCPTVLVARMSSGDPRERHRGISHHTLIVLRLLLGRAIVALPKGTDPELPDDERHDFRGVGVDLPGYAASGLPAKTMGRTLQEDPEFFAAALAAGTVLGEMA
ncbi:MAG: hypothetical protein QOE65_1710 [Solirubrobacteraceae bacterium]|nr:hypothetical protein [Solirubrobacteraceae bacterium]